MSLPDPIPDPFSATPLKASPPPLPEEGNVRRPQPLLSRQRLKQPRDLPDSPAPAPRMRHVESRSSRVFWRLLAAASLIGLGWGIAYFWRQTQVQGLVVAPPGFSLPQEACVVRDFSDDIRTLRGEVTRARTPYEIDLRGKEESLQRVQGDLSGLNERKNLLSQEIDGTQGEIQEIVAQNRADADRVWQTEGAALDAAYAAKMESLRQDLIKRAAQLHLSPDLDPAAPSPEIWVNSFRLALYNPPPNVKAPEERSWIEKQLADWHAFEKQDAASRDALKHKADNISKGMSGKLEGLHSRIAQRNAAIDEAEESGAPLQAEAETLRTEADAVRLQLSQQESGYATQLALIPARNVLEKLPLSPEGRFVWNHLEENPKYPPGRYLLWVPVSQGEAVEWAVVPFTVEANSCLDLIIKPGAFVPALDLLK